MSQDLASLRNYVTYDTGGQNRGETTVHATPTPTAFDPKACPASPLASAHIQEQYNPFFALRVSPGRSFSPNGRCCCT